MAKRKIVQVKLRLQDDLRAKLERSAKAREISVNAEIINRLDQSFTTESAVLSGEMRDFAILMATAFFYGGSNDGGNRAGPVRRVGEWKDDAVSFSNAVAWVVVALWSKAPADIKNDPETAKLIAQSIAHRLGYEEPLR